MDPRERDGPRDNGLTLVTRDGKTFGLEVDPWTAVETVPYLCAVSVNSSCEEFSEPKHMPRGTLFKNFAVWQSKGLSRNNRDEVNLNSIQGVYDDDSDIMRKPNY